MYFEWDRSDLTSVNRDTINAAVARAKTGGCSITLSSVEGHTDSSGGAAYNDKLSALVASKVGADLLVILSDVDGLHTANPARNRSARRACRR